MTKKQQLLDSLVKEIRREMESHFCPPKKHTKLSGKISPNSFNQNLKGVPGGPMNTRGRIIGAIMKMSEAEETGTLLASKTVLARLHLSGHHCDTTRSNYLV